MNIRLIIYSILIASISVFSQLTNPTGCWPLESTPISFGNVVAMPSLVSINESFLYLHGNTSTSLGVQSANATSGWAIGPASVDNTVYYSIVKKRDAKGQVVPIVFSSVLNGTNEGGYYISDANLRNPNEPGPSLSQGLISPKLEAFGVADTSSNFFLLGRAYNRINTVLSFTEIKLVNGLKTNLKSIALDFDAQNFDIFAEVPSGLINKIEQTHVYLVSNVDGKTLQIDNLNYGGTLAETRIRATINYALPGNLKIIGGDADKVYLAIKNTKSSTVEVVAIAKKMILDGAIITPEIIASFASSSDLIEISEMINGAFVYLAVNNGASIEVREVDLLRGAVVNFPAIKTLTNAVFAFDRTSKGLMRIAVFGKLGNSSVYKFVEAPLVPEVKITDAYLSNSTGGVQLPYVKTKKVSDSLFVNCGLFEYNRKIKFDYASVIGVEQINLNGTWIAASDSNSRIWITESTIYNTRISFRNQCFTSGLLNVNVVGQNFSPGQTATVPSVFCQGQSSVIDMTSTPNWVLANGTFDLNYPTQLVDTLLVTDLLLRQVTKFPQKTINVASIPYSGGSSRMYAISKKMATKEGCIGITPEARFSIYKSPSPGSIAINRALGTQKLLVPTDGKSISDTALYFAWGDKATTAQLIPTFDNTTDMEGVYNLGPNFANISIASGKNLVVTVDTLMGSASSIGKTFDLIIKNYNNTNIESRACSAQATYKFLMKKVGFSDLGLRIVGDSIIKPGNLYSFGVYSLGLANKLTGLDYRFKWKVFSDTNLQKPVAKRFVELTDTTTIVNTNKLLGKTNGKYVLQVEIYLQQISGSQKYIGTLQKVFEVQTPVVVATESGGTIDPNRLGSNLCKVDTFSCTGLYLKSVSFSNLSQNRGGCTNSPSVDNTTDTSKFVKVFTNENYQFALKVGNEYSKTGVDSASVVAIIDYDNDGVVGEVGEVFVSAYAPVSEVSVLYSIPNLPENIGDKRLTIILSNDEISSTTDLCNLIANDGTVQEDFLIHIESPPSLLITSFITPNGDGKNDNFEVRGVDERYGTKLTIYNKFGAYVYEKEGVGLSTYNSDGFEKNLKPDTYYYLFINGDLTSKGFFEVR